MDNVHLSGENLLKYQSGELCSSERDAARRHLASCQQCREACEELERLFEDLRNEYLLQGQDALASSIRAAEVPRVPILPRPMPWRTLAASSVTVLVAGAVLFWNTFSLPLSAAELVTRAIQEERIHSAEQGRGVRVRSRFGMCNIPANGGRKVTQEAASCARAWDEMESVHWDLQNPLSARSFARWRSSLASKRDEVTRQDHGFVLRTIAASGELRAAALELRDSDYRVVAAKLEFQSSGVVEITEGVSPDPLPEQSLQQSIASASAPRAVVTPAEVPHDDFVDSAELEARLKLNELHADGGFETVVRRNGDSIEVFGLTDSPERTLALTSALGGIPGVVVHIESSGAKAADADLPFPLREKNNTLPALAADWLEQTHAEAELRGEFVSAVLGLSKSILGEASIIASLRERRSALNTPVAQRSMSQLESDHAAQLALVLTAIRPRLEPLAGPLPERGEITLEQAQTLDTALIRLLSASREGAGTLEDNLNLVRQAFEEPVVPARKKRH